MSTANPNLNRNRNPNSPPLPFVFLNAAMTADGKIAPARGRYVPFGSRRDQRHLLELRATADAVMAGARTVDSFPVNLGPGPAKYRRLRIRRGLAEHNLRVIVSGAGTIDPRAEIFRRRFSPILILTTGRVSKARLRRLRELADKVKIFGRDKLNLRAALQWLRKEWGVRRLLCEGGGELNAALFEAGLVNEIHLTICPVIFGGRHSPTLSGGAGVKRLARAARLEFVSMKRAGGEIFLVCRASARESFSPGLSPR
ncbi:MAG: dihydrofolate reductase family protein [Verrucomicrobiota bacterium]